MDGDFSLDTPGWYEAQNIAEIDGFDKDDYGNTWYNVKFQGDAETYMWLAKNQPEEGKKYYGHLQKTSSGKKIRFKTDKVPENKPVNSGYKDNSKSITLGMVWKTVAHIRGLPEDDEQFAKFFEIVDSHLNELLSMNEKLNEVENEKG